MLGNFQQLSFLTLSRSSLGFLQSLQVALTGCSLFLQQRLGRKPRNIADYMATTWSVWGVRLKMRLCSSWSGNTGKFSPLSGSVCSRVNWNGQIGVTTPSHTGRAASQIMTEAVCCCMPRPEDDMTEDANTLLISSLTVINTLFFCLRFFLPFTLQCMILNSLFYYYWLNKGI